MKKITIKGGFLLTLCLGAALTGHAQTAAQQAKIKAQTDLAAVKEISRKAKERFQANYKLALELAEQNGWPLMFRDGDKGSTSVLAGVSESGTPLYRETTNEGSAFTSRVNNINGDGLLGYNLNGQDMLIGMWEVGFPLTSHNELSGRIVSGDGSAFTGDDSGEGEEGINFHATHVAGTMIGNGSVDAWARGMAFEANMRAYDSFGDLGEAGDAIEDFGLLISNHSYGFNINFVDAFVPGAYTQFAAEWDGLHVAAPYYQAVMSAGNTRSGEEKDELVHEKNAKNVIVVAAVHELPAGGYTDPSDVEMSDFSTYGPTDDRRIKPDISNKGVAVWSCSSAGNSAHASAQGTSMAAPGTAGALLLLQQHYMDLHEMPMRAATLKGLMTHTADEAGDDPGPDHRFGWGLVNATKAVLLMDADHDAVPTSIIREEIFTPADESYQILVEVTGESTLKATIAWTDPVGPVNNGTPNSTMPRLVNDLDLRIIKMNGNEEGEIFLPWVLANPVTDPADKADNTVDNIEVVEVLEPEPGIYKIKVTYKELSGFANQRFSLIADKFEEILGVTDNKLATMLSVYPNPASNMINIRLDSSIDTSDCAITLYDMQGRVVKQFDKYVESINVSDLSAGIYLLNIAADGGKTTRKIVVE